MATVLGPTAADIGNACGVDAELDQANDQGFPLGRTGYLAQIQIRDQPCLGENLAPISRP